MTVSSYLFKKYEAFAKNTSSKPFTSDHVALELQCSSASATLTIREVLGKAYSTLNYFQFEKVVCTSIDLE